MQFNGPKLEFTIMQGGTRRRLRRWQGLQLRRGVFQTHRIKRRTSLFKRE